LSSTVALQVRLQSASEQNANGVEATNKLSPFLSIVKPGEGIIGVKHIVEVVLHNDTRNHVQRLFTPEVIKNDIEDIPSSSQHGGTMQLPIEYLTT